MFKKMNNNLKTALFHGLLITFGSFIIAIGVGFFLVPMQIINGGLSGIAIITKHLFNWPIDLVVAILNIILFLIGLFFLGKDFTLKTLISTIVYPIFLSLILRVSSFNLGLDINNDTHRLLGAIFGGALLGIGVALTFIAGGSTGGVDILYFILKKAFHIKPSISAFIIDALIILAGIFSVSLIVGLFGVLSAFIAALVIEVMFVGMNPSYMALIISSKAEEINHYIQYTMERGATLIDVKGGYKNAPYTMIQVAIGRRELQQLKDEIYKIDPKAFAIFTQVSSINGYGFEPFSEKLTPKLFQKKEDEEL